MKTSANVLSRSSNLFKKLTNTRINLFDNSVVDPESEQVETYITLLPFQYLLVPMEFLEHMSFFDDFDSNFIVYADEQLRFVLSAKKEYK